MSEDKQTQDWHYNRKPPESEPAGSTSQSHQGPSPSREDYDTSATGKGKGKEPSFGERLRDSGKMVAETMTSPHGLSNFSTSSGKTSQAGESSIAGKTSMHQETSVKHSRGDMGSNLESFKSTQASHGRGQDFDDFVASQPTFLPEEEPRAVLSSATKATYEATDGAAVVELLSQPDDSELMPDYREHDDGLSPEGVEKLRAALFSSPRSGLPWDDLLNFTPQFVAHPQANGTDTEIHLGTTDPNAAKHIWLDQWSDVLSAYTDEVWGDLGTLAAEARQEVKDLAEHPLVQDQDQLGQGALGRLRMILAHVRGPSQG